MTKFLSYENWLEIEGGLKEHMIFTEIGKKLSRNRTTITKENRNYSIEQKTGYGSFLRNTCKYRKSCKMGAGQMIVSIHWFHPAESANCFVTVTVGSLRRKCVHTGSNHPMSVTLVAK